MRPLDIAATETALRAAIDAGNIDEINRLGEIVNTHERANPEKKATLAAAALWYASTGLHVFPLQPGSKVPYAGSHGCKEATTDPERIRVWWTKAPDSNIGIATGHSVDVVDIDGTAGQLSRAQHWDDIFSGIETDCIAKVLTPRPGGMHLYVPATGDGNKAGILPSVDYRGSGGYVVAPPSTITSGPNPGEYTFLSAPRFTAAKAA